MTARTEPHYPNVEVPLIGENGNGFLILGKTAKAMRKDDVSEEGIKRYMDEATSGDYENLLRVTMEYVTIV